MNNFNSNPTLFACSNGVLELQVPIVDPTTGHTRVGVNFRPRREDDIMTFTSGVPYTPYDPTDPNAIAGMSELREYFAQVFPQNEMREYMMTLLSSCLEGVNREQRVYFMVGPGSTSTSTLNKLISLTLGNYAGTLPSSVLELRKTYEGYLEEAHEADENNENNEDEYASTDKIHGQHDLQAINGKRYISVQELDSPLNSALVKQVCGEDPVDVRPLYGESDKMRIMGKVFMTCNELPLIPSVDPGIWRRIRVVPFTSRFCETPSSDPAAYEFKADHELETKLPRWREAFLSLLVHYYSTVYLVDGLKEPGLVTAKSREMEVANSAAVSKKKARELVAKYVDDMWMLMINEGHTMDWRGNATKPVGQFTTMREFLDSRVSLVLNAMREARPVFLEHMELTELPYNKDACDELIDDDSNCDIVHNAFDHSVDCDIASIVVPMSHSVHPDDSGRFDELSHTLLVELIRLRYI